MDYVVATHYVFGEFIAQVNLRLKDKYVPQGGISTVMVKHPTTGNDVMQLTQAFIKQ
jgi:hypothetical protein